MSKNNENAKYAKTLEMLKILNNKINKNGGIRIANGGLE